MNVQTRTRGLSPRHGLSGNRVLLRLSNRSSEGSSSRQSSLEEQQQQQQQQQLKQLQVEDEVFNVKDNCFLSAISEHTDENSVSVVSGNNQLETFNMLPSCQCRDKYKSLMQAD